jgi:hypothetical protein
MYHLFQTDIGSRGSLAEVWVDRENKLVKKYYKPGNITITGKSPRYTNIEEITNLFENEIYWSTKLKSKFVLEIYEYGKLNDEPGYYIVQEWMGTDLLHERGHTVKDEFPNLKIQFPDIVEQLEEMFSFYQDHNLHKINNAMCNLTGANGKIKAFDFKYATTRTEESKILELYSVDIWLSKIDSILKTKLRKYI